METWKYINVVDVVLLFSIKPSVQLLYWQTITWINSWVGQKYELSSYKLFSFIQSLWKPWFHMVEYIWDTFDDYVAKKQRCWLLLKTVKLQKMVRKSSLPTQKWCPYAKINTAQTGQGRWLNHSQALSLEPSWHTFKENR